MKKIAITIIVAYLAIFAIAYNVAKKATKPALTYITPKEVIEVAPPVKQMGIVRLHEVVSGTFVCSGVVIGKTTLFTAAHCIPDEMVLEVRAANGVRTGIIAYAVGGNPRADLAIMRGRLKRFQPLTYSASPKVILNNIESNARTIIACGFPYGGELLCSPVLDRRMFAFHISGRGYLYPGMSGGPVIDEATGTVIGVNSAVTEKNILLAPLIEIWAACNVQPEP